MIYNNEKMLLEHFKNIKTCKTKTFICENIDVLQSEFQFIQADDFKDHFIVTHILNKIPKEKILISDFTKSLAIAAYELWPFWYGIKNCIDSKSVFSDTIPENKLDIKNISKLWLKKSIKSCKNNRTPFFKDFPNKIQSSQLSLILKPKTLIFAVYVEDTLCEPDKLLGLARATEWFSKETKGSVALLLPEKLKNYRELDSILYNSVFIPDEEKTVVTGSRYQSESKFNIWPIEDKPHPLSPGEKKLAEVLSKSEELKGLFQFNKKITTTKNTNYFVDLLWPEGKLVIEIDGYKYHKSKRAFQADRTRDYELSISNYMVLRLTHDEVMNNMNCSLNKIRDMVNFSKKQK